VAQVEEPSVRDFRPRLMPAGLAAALPGARVSKNEANRRETTIQRLWPDAEGRSARRGENENPTSSLRALPPPPLGIGQYVNDRAAAPSAGIAGMRLRACWRRASNEGRAIP